MVELYQVSWHERDSDLLPDRAKSLVKIPGLFIWAQARAVAFKVLLWPWQLLFLNKAAMGQEVKIVEDPTSLAGGTESHA